MSGVNADRWHDMRGAGEHETCIFQLMRVELLQYASHPYSPAVITLLNQRQCHARKVDCEVGRLVLQVGLYLLVRRAHLSSADALTLGLNQLFQSRIALA